MKVCLFLLIFLGLWKTFWNMKYYFKHMLNTLASSCVILIFSLIVFISLFFYSDTQNILLGQFFSSLICSFVVFSYYICCSFQFSNYASLLSIPFLVSDHVFFMTAYSVCFVMCVFSNSLKTKQRYFQNYHFLQKIYSTDIHSHLPQTILFLLNHSMFHISEQFSLFAHLYKERSAGFVQTVWAEMSPVSEVSSLILTDPFMKG